MTDFRRHHVGARALATATASALLALGLTTAGAAPAAAATLEAHDAESWEQALGEARNSDGPDTIVITDDFSAPGTTTLTTVYGGLTVEGQGHTVTWDGLREGPFLVTVEYGSGTSVIKDLTIDGFGRQGTGVGLALASTTQITLDNVTIIGSADQAPLHLHTGGSADLTDVTIRGAAPSRPAVITGGDGSTPIVTARRLTIEDASSDGAVLSLEGVSTTIQDSTFHGNEGGTGVITATGDGDLTVIDSVAGGNEGYAIRSEVPLIVKGSTFEGAGGEASGAISMGNDSPLTISESTFLDHDGGIEGVVSARGSVEIDSSTFARNVTEGYFVGVIDVISEGDHSTSVTNSTFAHNESEVSALAVSSDGPLLIAASTFAGNAGHADDVSAFVGSYTLTGNVFASRNAEGSCQLRGEDEDGSTKTWNYDSTGSCGAPWNGEGNFGAYTKEPPLLGELADNGGPTLTMAPQPNSPLIDVIPREKCRVDADQRGMSRPQGAGCDVGAVEFEAGFIDVTPTSSEFHDQIAWLASEGISTGWPTERGREFRPYEPITRDAMAAFLYRYAGYPEVTLPEESPFVDITTDNTAFYEQIVWLSQQGITEGWETDEGTEFRPFEPITRDAMAAFLYRFAEEPTWDVPEVSPFADITVDNTKFYAAITWLEHTGISAGYRARDTVEFRPFSSTTRDAMAAFLYRYDNLGS